jgi:hypothetical protein
MRQGTQLQQLYGHALPKAQHENKAGLRQLFRFIKIQTEAPLL